MARRFPFRFGSCGFVPRALVRGVAAALVAFLLAATGDAVARADVSHIGRAPERAWSLLSDAIACERRGDFAAAGRHASEAARVAAASGEGVVVGVCAHVRARLAARSARWDVARALLFEALDVLEQLAAPLDDESGASLRGAAAASVDLGVAIAAAIGDVESAFHFAERGRAGALRAARASHAAGPRPIRPASAAEVIAREAEAKAVAAYRAALGAVDDGLELLRLRRSADAARRAVAREGRRAAYAERGARPMGGGATTSLQALMGRLRADEAYVAYVCCDPGATAIVVTRHEARLVPIGARDEVASACEALLTTVARRASLSKALDRLRTLVVRPLGLSAPVRRVIVSPDGALAHVPPALWLAEFAVVYAPCATPLPSGGSTEGGHDGIDGGVLAVGDPALAVGNSLESASVRLRAHTPGRLDPLPFSAREARAVGDVALVGSDATVPRLARALSSRPRWSVVHLACHVWPDDTTPGLASLVLAPAPGDAGLLSAQELARWRLRADVVVLSGCRSGAGLMVRGEGALGLTRAALAAGARTVVSAAWPVDDEAAYRLWSSFYGADRRAPGRDTSSRLAAAQAALQRDPRFSDAASHAAWIVWQAFEPDPQEPVGSSTPSPSSRSRPWAISVAHTSGG